MHPTAVLVHANSRIADLFADAERVRLANRVDRTAGLGATARASHTLLRIGALARRLPGIVRAWPRATSC